MTYFQNTVDLCGNKITFNLQNAGSHLGCELHGAFTGQRLNEDVEIIGRSALCDMSIVNVTNSIMAFDGARLKVTGLRISGGYWHFLTKFGSYMELNQIDFGPNSGGSHAHAGVNSVVAIMGGSYHRVSGGGGAFFSCAGTGAYMQVKQYAVIFCDVPVAFSIAVLTSVELALLNIWDVDFVNGHLYSGIKYSAGAGDGWVYTGGKDPSFIPGTPGSGNYG
ncbi:MAG: hypothetical protein ACOH2J_04765 [Allorhizobium sp.]